MAVSEVIWQPQAGPQTSLISCPVFEVFYGGARGGGKTDASIGDWLEHCGTYGGAANGIFVRRTGKQLEEVVARTKELFPKLGATFREQKHEWEFPKGGRIKFRYLERDRDAEEYHGHNYTWLGVEEITNFPDPEPINKMRATLRSTKGARVRMVATGNPGGPGHQWVKERYVTPHKAGYKVLRERFWNPFSKVWVEQERVFIPARLDDNPLLLNSDPSYVARLQQQGSVQLVRAWLGGDWDIVLGAFFDCFDAKKHVLELAWLTQIPKESVRFRAFDWGSAKPFSVGWYAVSDGTWGLPRGALVKYREWYGASAPNVGIKLDAEMVARGVLAREKGDRIKYGVADPQIFVRDGGPSIGERMLVEGCRWDAADRKRRVGWDQLRRYLQGDGGIPLLYFIENCEATIRTIPTLPHDEYDTEDVDTESEDHAGDETRYAVMSRPYLDKVSTPAKPTDTQIGTYIKNQLKKLRQAREGARV